MAGMLTGCCVAIIPSSFEKDNIIDSINNYNPTHIIVDDSILLKNELTLNDLTQILPNINVHLLDFNFTDIEIKYPNSNYKIPESGLEDDCLVCYTSGSTSTPKGALFTQQAAIQSLMSTNLIPLKFRSDIMFNPIGQTGMILMLFYSFVRVDQDLHMIRVYSRDSLMKTIKKYNVKFIFGTPFVYQDLEQVIDKYEISDCLEDTIIGGQSWDYSKFRSICNKINPNIEILSGQTMTETLLGMIGYCQFPELMKRGEMNLIPQPHHKTKIINGVWDENEKKQVGEIVTKMPSLLHGYLCIDDKDVFTEEGQLKTGDVGWIDGKVIKLLDRNKDIVIVKGCNVSTKELESACQGQSGIQNCIVLAEIHPIFGEIPVVVCESESRSKSEFGSGKDNMGQGNQLNWGIEKANAQLMDIKRIRKVQRVVNLPILPSSFKYNRKCLRDDINSVVKSLDEHKAQDKHILQSQLSLMFKDGILKNEIFIEWVDDDLDKFD